MPQPCQPCCKLYGSIDFLLWWLDDAPLPAPLATTGNPADAVPAALGQPGTRVLFGGDDLSFDAFAGGRLQLGRWFDAEHPVGCEGAGFLLERQQGGFASATGPSSIPILAVPFLAIPAGTNSAFYVAGPDPLGTDFDRAGSLHIDLASQLWGAEFNGVFNTCCRPGLRIDALAGFRYLDLAESINFTGRSIERGMAQGVVVDDITRRSIFATRNQFYGGQLGLRGQWQRGLVSLKVQGKVALGAVHQVVRIEGSAVGVTTVNGITTSVRTPLGTLFSQPTNIGRSRRDAFAVAPELSINLGLQLTHGIRAYVGYDFLYLSNVVRPGNQIDPVINTTQSPIFGGGTLVGPARPAPVFNDSDFYAHGISFGLDCCW